MKTAADIQKILLANEERLSPFARKSSASAGRMKSMTPDPFRLEFARDETRILHSPPFRRLKHKTQVFLFPDNDHICTRMEHVLHVSSIASVIGRCLNLNTDLVRAIATGHDLGHPPFGHAGESVLNAILLGAGVATGFMHEVHGLRVVDKLTNLGAGLNLTFEVRDGIITHCGERFERKVAPDRRRDLKNLEAISDRDSYPSTLEGCLVRLVDRIAYLGRDLEDALKAGLIRKKDVPAGIVKNLGIENGQIIGCFVNDTITNSMGKDCIEMSSEVFAHMRMLKEFNYSRIYRNPEVERRSRKAASIIELLYHRIEKIFSASDRGRNRRYIETLIREAPLMEVFFHFIKNTNYTEETPPWRMVTDYMAGMTDLFAERTFGQLFLPSPVI
ncbi:MAG: HD domain-containing protein [Chitinispirillaceae bacterium]|jgi:dGTPase|nr:HD domain-containing protein [Chitinispirillaceae bacterium]